MIVTNKFKYAKMARNEILIGDHVINEIIIKGQVVSSKQLNYKKFYENLTIIVQQMKLGNLICN